MKISFVASILFSLLFTQTVAAQVSSQWRQETERLQQLGDAACNDAKALERLKTLAGADDAVASFFVYRAMSRTDCANHTTEVKEWNRHLKAAAKAKYPDAVRHVGRNYLHGYGSEKNKKLGQVYLITATALGSPEAAAEMAHAYGSGELLPYDRWYALKYLEQAVASGLDESATDDVLRAIKPEIAEAARQTVARAKADPAAIQAKRLDFLAQFRPRYKLAADVASSGAGREAAGYAPAATAVEPTSEPPTATAETTAAQSPAAAGSGAETPKYVALAVSHADAAYGFGTQFDSQEAAESRALEECRKRRGRECDVKVVVRGPGCAAYRYNAGQSVYGWGYSKDKGAAEARAAEECRKRNGNQACQADAWACNERSAETVAVVLEKEMPAAQPPTGGVCLVMLAHGCDNFTNATHNGKRFGGITVRAFPDFRVSFPNCGSSDNHDSVGWNWTKNSWTEHSTDQGVPDTIKQQMKAVLSKYRAAVQSKFPNCGKPRNYSSITSIQFFAEQSQYDFFRNREMQAWDRKIDF